MKWYALAKFKCVNHQRAINRRMHGGGAQRFVHWQLRHDLREQAHAVAWADHGPLLAVVATNGQVKRVSAGLGGNDGA